MLVKNLQQENRVRKARWQKLLDDMVVDLGEKDPLSDKMRNLMVLCFPEASRYPAQQTARGNRTKSEPAQVTTGKNTSMNALRCWLTHIIACMSTAGISIC